MGVNEPHCSVLILPQRSDTAGGRPTTIPVNMMSDMPLPMPRSLICSPSHMMNAEPVVSVSMVIKINRRPG